jgi:hypothetical protein
LADGNCGSDLGEDLGQDTIGIRLDHLIDFVCF